MNARCFLTLHFHQKRKSMIHCCTSLLFFASFLIKRADGYSNVSVAVIFNGTCSLHVDCKTYLSFPHKMSLKPQKTLDTVENVKFVYKNLNSSSCDLRKALSIVENVFGFDVVMLQDLNCRCQQMLSFYLNNMKKETVASSECPTAAIQSFRVPIVEYFPFIVKHFVRKCMEYSLPCYGQSLNDDNKMVCILMYGKNFAEFFLKETCAVTVIVLRNMVLLKSAYLQNIFCKYDFNFKTVLRLLCTFMPFIRFTYVSLPLLTLLCSKIII